MSGAGRLTGEPWHVEVLSMGKGDSKRHRSRCVYYAKTKDQYCRRRDGRCMGSTHCDWYMESSDEKQQYEHKREVYKELVVPEGIFTLYLDEVKVDQNAANTFPEKKVQGAIKYYREHHEMKHPIVVEKRHNTFYMASGYDVYLATKRLHLRTIKAESSESENFRKRKALRKRGTHIWDNRKKEKGVIIDTSMTTFTVRYNGGATADISYEHTDYLDILVKMKTQRQNGEGIFKESGK